MIRKFSKKRAAKEREYIKVCKKIDSEREPICEGCGGNKPLSHSHLLSKYDRPDLIAEEENIRLHCFYGYQSCHSKWERKNPKELIEMNDFKENLEYIRKVDAGEYNKIVAKFEFEGVQLP